MNKKNNTIIKILCFIFAIICTTTFSFVLKNKLYDNFNDNVQNICQDTDTNYKKIELAKAYVTKVVDGDTIWVKIDNEDFKVRFIGIDCPEYTKEIETYGKEATEFTAEKLLNTTVYLQKDITDKDKYDRLLRYVWVENISELTDENISNYLFNYTLVHEGLAESIKYKPNISLQNILDKAQKYAQENKKGMWQ